jgi:cytochrome c oxidase subunit III
VSELVAPSAHAEFQYPSAEHQAKTAIAGMWLFLATDLLFFGALFYLWMLLRRWHLDGFHKAAGDTDLLIGSVNTVLLVTTSFVYAWGLHGAKAGRNREVLRACLVTGGIGILFVGLKVFEWIEDVGKGAWPGQNFQGAGPDPGGQHLFWLLYYAGTSLHLVHMLIGIGLVFWIAWQAYRHRFSADNYTAVEGVGLYWSFVDLVWLNLYPFIYLVDRR